MWLCIGVETPIPLQTFEIECCGVKLVSGNNEGSEAGFRQQQ